MTYDFDEVIDRRNTNSLKHDFVAEHGLPEDLLPMWVADMDFKTPPAVTEALVNSSLHSIFGYSECKEKYFEVLDHWFKTRFQWRIQRSWLVKTPGVIFAVSAAIRSLTQTGDAVLIQQPVYYPFAQIILANERLLVNNELVYRDGAYSIDFDDFETKIAQHQVKLFILCSPHNPVGRVWTRDELTRMGEICIRNHVFIVSDEIHMDFVFDGYQHHILADVRPDFLENVITCTSPSKTFNLAGLQISNIFIANPTIRKKIILEIQKTGYSQLNTMGIIACQAAYEAGEDWLSALKQYLAGNLSFIRQFLSEKLPQIKLVEPQGTYLAWLDFSGLGLSEEQLKDLIVHRAKLWLDHGTMFGAVSKGFERINIACPRIILERAFCQLEKAVNRYPKP